MTNAIGLAAQFGLTPGLPAEMTQIGDRFVFAFDELGVTIELARVEMSKASGHALVRATTTLPGHNPIVMHDTRFNLTSARERRSLAKYLEGRVNLDELLGETWEDLLERVCGAVLMVVRDGADVVTLGTLPRTGGRSWAVKPVAPRNDRAGIYGDSGTNKSTLADAIAIAYKTGLPLAGLEPMERGNVLIADFETDAETTQWRIDALVRGFGITDVHIDGGEAECVGPDDCPYPHINYMRCDFPLVEMAEAIARQIADKNIGLVIIDSLTFAADGSAKDEDVVIPQFNAMRRWKCSVLFVDHVTVEKDGREQSKPYGSRFKRNAARLLWHVRATSDLGEPATAVVGLYSEKSNYTGKLPDLGFRIEYLRQGAPSVGADPPDEIRIEAIDVREEPAQRKNLSHSTQILLVLRDARESLTVDDIAERSDIKRDTVKARLNDLKKQGRVVDFTANGVQAAKRWAIASHREDGE